VPPGCAGLPPRGGRGGQDGQPVSLLFAFLSALFAAVNLLTQRVSSRTGPSGSPWRLAAYLLRQPLWLFGVAAAVGSIALQALALHFGSLARVQPIRVTELVFVLMLRRVWLHQPIRGAAWGSAVLTCVGLALFLAAAEPRGGNAGATPSAWVEVIVVLGGAAVLTALLGTRGSPKRRAGLYGSAAALTAALFATFVKEVTNILGVDGPIATLTSWPIYAAVLCGSASALLIQAALHVGPLTISQPLIVAIDPIVSIWLTVWLFAGYFTQNVAVIALGACGFLALIVGVVVLTGTAPQHDAGLEIAVQRG
jgi:hypothetical protein